MSSVRVHDLSTGTPGDSAPTVILAHGITANGLSWAEVAAELGRRHGDGALRVLAPDLRGRADSREVGPPYGMASHVADLAEIAAGVSGKPVLAGHSMGGFVVAVAMATKPDVFRGAVMVDGGMAFETPEGVDVDAALQAVIGPAMTRLTMTFPSEQAYLDFWRDHPAVGPLLAGPAGPTVRRYLLHDLVPGEGGLVSSCVLAAIREDGGAVLLDPSVVPAVANAAGGGARLELVWAARGMMNEEQGLYDDTRLAALNVPESVRVTKADANHYSIILDEAGVTAVCDAIDRMLED